MHVPVTPTRQPTVEDTSLPSFYYFKCVSSYEKFASDINRWITFAVKLGVQELRILVHAMVRQTANDMSLKGAEIGRVFLSCCLSFHGPFLWLKNLTARFCEGLEEIELSATYLTTLEVFSDEKNFNIVFSSVPNLGNVFCEKPCSGSFPVDLCNKIATAVPQIQSLIYVLFYYTDIEIPERHFTELKEVEIGGFRGTETELELALYLLRNAVAIEQMVIKSCLKRFVAIGESSPYLELQPWTALNHRKIIEKLQGKAASKVHD
ncbi:hypothetical protein JCGZ_08218 [Jatropha curcas]|uniref:FBD domain-containing protein n=1 Tax=Jatropha curcas TaxID=180498 RepID=A0A067KLB7_JATCU|nr:hypothetical protein JCGZ_08218 [Jatropha curcas]